MEQALQPKEPLTAATTWAEGVKTRNAAVQYAVMAPDLQKEYYPEFDEAHWTTGVSSPWIESYQIDRKSKIDVGTYRYAVSFTYTDSTKNTSVLKELITVKKINDHWFVSNIEKLDVAGQIEEILMDKDQKVAGIFLKGNQEQGAYDQAKLMIGKETVIYQGYSDKRLELNDLRVGLKVEATFLGPVLEIYPVQGGVKTIRVFE